MFVLFRFVPTPLIHAAINVPFETVSALQYSTSQSIEAKDNLGPVDNEVVKVLASCRQISTERSIRKKNLLLH